jgi:hypothetical protein
MEQTTSLVEYGPRRIVITVTAVFCATLEIIDTTIVNVALNDMKGNLGATVVIIGISSLQYVLEKGQEDDWFSSKVIIGLTFTAVVGILLFIWRQLVYRYPVVELRVLKNGNLRIGVMLSFVIG